MITVKNLTKIFRSLNKNEDTEALSDISCTIPEGCVYGLVGSNGAGKSTLLRLLAGVYAPDAGEIRVDDMPVFDNPAAKGRIFFVPDESYFPAGSTLRSMAKTYALLYPRFSRERFDKLTQAFGLDPKKELRTFSKGMKRQAAMILALSTLPQYLFFDETFDGLDPVKRKLVKSVIYQDVLDRRSTVIIASHSLRELEDTCDQLVVLHKGGIVFESDVENLKSSHLKVQIALPVPFTRETFTDAGIDVCTYEQNGSVASMTVRGSREDVLSVLGGMEPLVCDVLPLGLEEVFVLEMQTLGYSADDLLL